MFFGTCSLISISVSKSLALSLCEKPHDEGLRQVSPNLHLKTFGAWSLMILRVLRGIILIFEGGVSLTVFFGVLRLCFFSGSDSLPLSSSFSLRWDLLLFLLGVFFAVDVNVYV